MFDNKNNKLAKSIQNGCINYGSQGLRNLPKLIKCSKDDIFDIDLSQNYFTFLPESICEFQSSQNLNCSNNLIRSIPSCIVNLIFLEKLDLSCNHLSILNPSICKLEYLKILILSSNRLVSLPQSIGNLPILEELDASCNSLTCIPNELSTLRKLRILNLRHNKLLDVPNNLISVPLEYLDLSENQLNSLPTQFHLFNNLQQFSVHSNPITFPPINVCNRGLQHIMKYLKTNSQRLSKIHQIHSAEYSTQNNATAFFNDVYPEEKFELNSYTRGDSGYNTINDSLRQEFNLRYQSRQISPNPEDSRIPSTEESVNVVQDSLQDPLSSPVSGHFRKNRNQSSLSNCTSPVVLSPAYKSNRFSSSRQRILNNEKSTKSWRSSMPIHHHKMNNQIINHNKINNSHHDVELESQCVVEIDSIQHESQNYSNKNVNKQNNNNNSTDLNSQNGYKKEEPNKKVQEKIKILHKTIEAQLHVQISSQNLSSELSNGIYLCHLANIFSPNSIITIHTPSPGQNQLSKQKSKRNLENFLEVCRRNGVGEAHLFSIKDALNCDPGCLLEISITVDTLLQSIRQNKIRKSMNPTSSTHSKHDWQTILANPQSTLSKKPIPRRQIIDNSLIRCYSTNQDANSCVNSTVKNNQNRSFHINYKTPKSINGIDYSSTTLGRSRKSMGDIASKINSTRGSSSSNNAQMDYFSKSNQKLSSKTIVQYSSEV